MYPKNIILCTQDQPGERDWISQLFPTYKNVETKSSGQWQLPADSNTIWETPYIDHSYQDLHRLLDNSYSIKTVFTQDLPYDFLIGDNLWTETEDLIIHPSIRFSTSTSGISQYMMFTMTRCATVLQEEILQKTYTAIADHHAVPSNTDVVQQCSDPNTLICFMYRQDWWRWACSKLITARNMLDDHTALHYDSPVNFDQLTPIEITKNDLDQLESVLKRTFNLWCNIRMIYPNHTVELYRFETSVCNQQATHLAIPYRHEDFIINYESAKQLFLSDYLTKWQTIESNVLKHLSKMGIRFN